MTAHETRPDTVENTPSTESLDPRHEALESQQAPADAQPQFEQAEPVDSRHESLESQQPSVESQPPVEQVDQSSSAGSTDQTLFPDGDLSGFRARWTEVQAAFVDDPRDCVQKADRLVADVVEQLTASFGHARSGLEEQWSRGEQVSTEDLRIALQRYRDFFERLLAV